MCGSEFVTENFLRHLQRQAAIEVGRGGFDELCVKHLGISPAEGIRQASIHIENIKKEFSTPKAGPKYIIIHAAQRAERASWEVKVDR